MDMHSLGLFALTMLLATLYPGPSVAALVARVLTGGFISVLPFLAALWIGELLWLTAAGLGLGALSHQYVGVFFIVKYLGIAYLAYMAWTMWTTPQDEEAATLPNRKSGLSLFLAGMALTLGNPKNVVFYLALLPSIVSLDNLTMSAIGQLLIVALVVLVTVDLSWSFAASMARKWLQDTSAMRYVRRIGATTMGGAALVLATRN